MVLAVKALFDCPFSRGGSTLALQFGPDNQDRLNRVIQNHNLAVDWSVLSLMQTIYSKLSGKLIEILGGLVSHWLDNTFIALISHICALGVSM